MDHVFLLSAQEFKENLIIIKHKSALLKIIISIIPKYERYLKELQPVMIHVTVYSRAKNKIRTDYNIFLCVAPMLMEQLFVV